MLHRLKKKIFLFAFRRQKPMQIAYITRTHILPMFNRPRLGSTCPHVMGHFPTKITEPVTDVVNRWAGNMNCLESNAKNYLYTCDKDDDRIKDFFEIAASLVRSKKVVLVFTRRHVDFTPILAGLSKDQMQNLLISYNSDLSSLIDKLLELHDWEIQPHLVILNLNSFFDVAEAVPPFKKVCFCISTLFHYMRSLDKQMMAKQPDGHRGPTSITLLNAHPDVRIQLVIDFYFYKSAMFSELDVMKEVLSIRF